MESSTPPHFDANPTKYDPPAVVPTPDAVPPDAVQKIDRKKLGLYLMAGIYIASVVLYFATGGKTPILPPPNIDGAAEPPPQYAMGWVDDRPARAASLARLPAVDFATTPAGRAALAADKQESFLWRAVRKAAGRKEADDWYCNINQRDVGCCVGAGWKHGADVCAAVQVINGKAEEFHPLSAETIYGLSRVDIGGGQIRGDGSLGSWAREAVAKFGVARMRKFDSVDLTEFSPARAREYGTRGVPADVKTEAKAHPIKATALVSSWADVQRSIMQGYPVAVCSNVGFADPDGQSPGTRDKDGFCAARATWPHCMCLIGVRDGNRPGAFCLNSWGDTAHRGPVWPADAPKAGFWIDANTVDRMVRQGDSYALAELEGFPARQLDWFFGAAPPLNDPFAFLAGQKHPDKDVGFCSAIGKETAKKLGLLTTTR